MAGYKELTDGVTSLALRARARSLQVQNTLEEANDGARENVPIQPRQPVAQEYPKYLTVSVNPETEVTGMWLTASNKLWVKYRPPGAHVDYLKLFGNDGKELRMWRGDVIPEGLSLTCVEDTLLSLQNWRWIRPFGESGCLDNAPNSWALCSKSISPPYALLRSCENIGKTGLTYLGKDIYRLYRLNMLSADPLKVELVSVCTAPLAVTGYPLSFDVSSCGTMFCVSTESLVEIFCTENPLNSSTVFKLVSGSSANISLQQYLITYQMKSTFVSCSYDLTFEDACFFLSYDKRDTLMSSVRCSYTFKSRCDARLPANKEVINIMLELDHDDGFFVKWVMTSPTFCSCVTAHGPDGRVWMGCKGGQINVQKMWIDYLRLP